ncbi:hypothetical protein ACHAQA_003532 [Verticillium albo-atrum]
METPDLRHPSTRSPEEADEYTSAEDDGDDHFNGQEEYMEEQVDEQIEDQLEEDHEGDLAAHFDPSARGLKEISNLGKFTVSSHKPGNGVDEMRSDDTDEYWQMTVYFVKRVGIRDIRFYVDYQSDESYTPTKIVFKSGTSENNLIEFAVMELTTPSGWQQVPIAGAGGGPDGNTLACYVFQMQILENHQNGKDTHLRGIKIYAADTDARSAETGSNPMAEMVELIDKTELRGEDDEFAEEDSDQRIRRLEKRLRARRWDPSEGGMSEPDFMKEPEIR